MIPKSNETKAEIVKQVISLFYKTCLDLVRGLVGKHGAVMNNLKLFRVKLPTSQTHKQRHKW